MKVRSRVFLKKSFCQSDQLKAAEDKLAEKKDKSTAMNAPITRAIKVGFHFQTTLITIAANIVSIIIVVVTAMPYAAAKFAELLNVITTTTTINNTDIPIKCFAFSHIHWN